MENWLERVSWERRNPALGPLRLAWNGSSPAISTMLPFTHPLAKIWDRLTSCPTILEAGGADEHGCLLLGYAAIDWMRPRAALASSADIVRLATWGLELTRAFEFLWKMAPPGTLGHFASPTVFVDLAERTRLGFFTRDATRLPPEVNATWPTCSERGLVFVVGQTLTDLFDFEATRPDHPIVEIVTRCRSEDPALRYATLGDLRRAFRRLWAPRMELPPTDEWEAWLETECGIGYLLLDRPLDALECFRRALRHDHRAGFAELGVNEVVRRDPVLAAGHYAFGRHLSWVLGEELANQRIAARDFANALRILRATKLEVETWHLVQLAMAHCCLATGEIGEAVDLARQLIARMPELVEAHHAHAVGHQRAGRHAEALAAVDAWLAVAPGDGRAHHTRGKVLLALGKMVDARASFDRATQVAPGARRVLVLAHEPRSPREATPRGRGHRCDPQARGHRAPRGARADPRGRSHPRRDRLAHRSLR